MSLPGGSIYIEIPCPTVGCDWQLRFRSTRISYFVRGETFQDIFIVPIEANPIECPACKKLFILKQAQLDGVAKPIPEKP